MPANDRAYVRMKLHTPRNRRILDFPYRVKCVLELHDYAYGCEQQRSYSYDSGHDTFMRLACSDQHSVDGQGPGLSEKSAKSAANFTTDSFLAQHQARYCDCNDNQRTERKHRVIRESSSEPGVLVGQPPTGGIFDEIPTF